LRQRTDTNQVDHIEHIRPTSANDRLGSDSDIDEIAWRCENRFMTRQLYIHLAQGIANEVDGYRTGARHALIIYATGDSLIDGQSKALEFATQNGWTFVEVQSGAEIGNDSTIIEDEMQRAAAESAFENGGCIVVYRDEIPADA
jgi:hypothetical protein